MTPRPVVDAVINMAIDVALSVKSQDFTSETASQIRARAKRNLYNALDGTMAKAPKSLAEFQGEPVPEIGAPLHNYRDSYGSEPDGNGQWRLLYGDVIVGRINAQVRAAFVVQTLNKAATLEKKNQELEANNAALTAALDNTRALLTKALSDNEWVKTDSDGKRLRIKDLEAARDLNTDTLERLQAQHMQLETRYSEFMHVLDDASFYGVKPIEVLKRVMYHYKTYPAQLSANYARLRAAAQSLADFVSSVPWTIDEERARKLVTTIREMVK